MSCTILSISPPLTLMLLLLLVRRVPTVNSAVHSFCNIERREAAFLSVSEFRQHFESKQRPVVIAGAAQAAGWSAIGRWSTEYMIQAYGHLTVHVGDAMRVPETSGFGNRSMLLREFAEACNGAQTGNGAISETVFDRQEFVRQAGRQLETETSPSLSYFEHWPQAGKGSTPYFSFGPTAVGLSFHEHSAACNVVLFGSKRWFIYPPLSQPKRVEPWVYDTGTPDSGDDGTASPASWSSEELFNSTFVDLRNPAVWAATVKQHLSGQARPLECVTMPGDLIYVPAGWAHAVANLEDSAALAWQLPPQDSRHLVNELAFRVAALAEHGRAAEAESLIQEQLPWLTQSSDATHADMELPGQDTVDPVDIFERMMANVRVGQVRRDSSAGACAAALDTARQLPLTTYMAGVGLAKIQDWATAFEPIAQCFLDAAAPAAASSAALEGIDSTHPQHAVSRQLYLLAAEAFRAQGLDKKATKMEKRAS